MVNVQLMAQELGALQFQRFDNALLLAILDHNVFLAILLCEASVLNFARLCEVRHDLVHFPIGRNIQDDDGAPCLFNFAFIGGDGQRRIRR